MTLIYCSISNKIFEYYEEHGYYFVFDGKKTIKVDPYEVYVKTCVQKTVIFLDR